MLMQEEEHKGRGWGGTGGACCYLGVGPGAAKKVLEGLHALAAAAVLHGLAGVSKGQGPVFQGQGHH